MMFVVNYRTPSIAMTEPNETDLLITGVRALEPGEGIVAEWIRVGGGKIAQLGRGGIEPPNCPRRIDGGCRLLTPGLIDIHTHGVERFIYEPDPEQLVAASLRLGRYGTTCVLPTVAAALVPERLDALPPLAAAFECCAGASMPGFHLEGPFLALPGAGVKTLVGDPALLNELWLAAGGKIAAMSISPETPNVLAVIERLCELGVVPLITHTRATVEQTQAAIDAGARHATHFYDVFPLPDETDPGVRPAGAVEAVLADSRCSLDVIADGVHVHPTAVRAAAAAKGFRNFMLITDSNVGAGLPPGVYDSPLGRVKTGAAARLDCPGRPGDGCLAGSTLTMDRGMANLLEWLDWPDEQIWAAGTANPARLLGLSDKGTLRVGADADLVLWEQTDAGPRAAKTWVAGRCIFDSNEDKENL
ncbi:MAG: amidohydrolase family protein [Pirellulaceae bacterium]|nr:amidohydrolase family protein [Pirellulaceae bacterium]